MAGCLTHSDTDVILAPHTHNGESAMVRHVPDSLLATLYLQLALRIAGTGLSERECEHCRKPFFPQRRDKRFCNKKCRELAGYHRRKNAA